MDKTFTYHQEQIAHFMTELDHLIKADFDFDQDKPVEIVVAERVGNLNAVAGALLYFLRSEGIGQEQAE